VPLEFIVSCESARNDTTTDRRYQTALLIPVSPVRLDQSGGFSVRPIERVDRAASGRSRKILLLLRAAEWGTAHTIGLMSIRSSTYRSSWRA